MNSSICETGVSKSLSIPTTSPSKPLLEKLVNLGQQHIIDMVKASPEKEVKLLESLSQVERSCPGGLENYIIRARKLLIDSANDVNPFDGYSVHVPISEYFDPETPQFSIYEKEGLENLDSMVYVLVAGGLGERLGYPGIKVELPVETVTYTSYLQYYCEYILALDKEAKRRKPNVAASPFLIMLSDDTYSKTLELMEENNYFGMDKSVVVFMKQAKVPALQDSSANMAINDDGSLLLKPHGHGDVHKLVMEDGKIQRFLDSGKKNMFIFQDTNALAFRILVASIGRHIQAGLAMSYICIPRKAKEAVGGICKLVKEGGSELTVNVEYNQLGPMLVSEGLGGDVGDERGFSKYPGNCNILLIDLKRYNDIMNETQGVIAEFVNPKYTDSTKTSFKSPTRLECMMQDYPKSLYASDKVGCATADRYLCFSTLKNSNEDAKAKIAVNNTPECAFSAESDYYNSNCIMLELAAKRKNAKVNIAPRRERVFNGVRYPIGPQVVLKPSFGVCLESMAANISENAEITISEDSVVVLGDGVISNMDIDGYYDGTREEGISGKKIDIGKVKNRDMMLEETNDKTKPLCTRMRGYEFVYTPHVKI